MKIKTSFVTASILRDQGKVGADLGEQINNLPVKADTVYLYVEQTEMKEAFLAIKKFMESSTSYHAPTFQAVLREVEYFANCDT